MCVHCAGVDCGDCNAVPKVCQVSGWLSDGCREPAPLCLLCSCNPARAACLSVFVSTYNQRLC